MLLLRLRLLPCLPRLRLLRATLRVAPVGLLLLLLLWQRVVGVQLLGGSKAVTSLRLVLLLLLPLLLLLVLLPACRTPVHSIRLGS